MNLKRRSGSILVELLIFLVVVVCMGVYSNGSAVNSMSGALSADMSRQGGRDIDFALGVWAGNHSAQYPDSLAVLQDGNTLPSHISLLPYSYTVSADKLAYRVVVTISDGSTYTTPGSNLP